MRCACEAYDVAAGKVTGKQRVTVVRVLNEMPAGMVSLWQLKKFWPELLMRKGLSAQASRQIRAVWVPAVADMLAAAYERAAHEHDVVTARHVLAQLSCDTLNVQQLRRFWPKLLAHMNIDTATALPPPALAVAVEAFHTVQSTGTVSCMAVHAAMPPNVLTFVQLHAHWPHVQQQAVSDAAARAAALAVHQPGTVLAASWPRAHSMLEQWKGLTARVFTAMLCCAMCGAVAMDGLGGLNQFHTIAPLDGSTPPYALANAFMAAFTTSASGAWHLCSACHAEHGAQRPVRCRHTFMLTPEYITMLLQLDPLATQLLSFTDAAISVHARYQAFAEGRLAPFSLLDSALILARNGAGAESGDANDDACNVAAMFNVPGTARTLQTLLQQLYATCPFYAKYISLIELAFPAFSTMLLADGGGLPASPIHPANPYHDSTPAHSAHTSELASMVTLPASSVDGILARDRARAPLALMGADVVREVLSTYVDATPMASTLPPKLNDIYTIGSLTLRDGLRTCMLRVTTHGYSVDDLEMSVETSLFPFLFAFGTGAWNGALRLYQYCHMRFAAFFSVFTLYKPYLIYMYLLRRASAIIAQSKQVCFESAIVKYLKKNPTHNEQRAYQHVMKFRITASVPGTPAWHRKQLSDLLYRVHRLGLPFLFLTLTCDEVSHLRWQEIDDLENFLTRFNSSFTYRDAPVECSALFVKRCQRFMRDHVLDKSGGIFGRVTNYLIRYEVQGRHSLHAHILLWVHTDDRTQVAAEITAAVPAEQCPTGLGYVQPTDTLQRQLQDIVLRKQVHRCSTSTCLKHDSGNGTDSHCSYGFPFPVHAERTPHLHERTGRYRYYRPRQCDAYIVPYHPTALLLWNAHLNVQVITDVAWSRYVLKYSLKCEPCGNLRLDADLASRLGLQGLNATQLKAVSAFCLTRPVSPTEAAMYLMGLDMLEHDMPVMYVDTTPPFYRSKKVAPTAAAAQQVAPVCQYAQRPSQAEEMTLYKYFRRCKLQKNQYTRVPKGMTLLGQDGYGSWVYRLQDDAGSNTDTTPTDLMVRFSDYHPIKETEAYCYNLLLEHIPFRSENQLLSPCNTSYYLECVHRGIISSHEDLHAHIESYSQRQLYDADEHGQLLNAMLDYHDKMVACEHGLASPNGQEDDGDVFTERIAQALNGMLHISSTLSAMAQCTLNSEQQQVFNCIVGAGTGLHVLSGAPGSGKTYLTKKLAWHLRSTGRRVLLCGSTGAAAVRLCETAVTLHKAIDAPWQGARYWHPLSPTNLQYYVLLHADVIIVDEMSMLTSNLLNHLLTRVQNVLASAEHPVHNALQAKLIVLVGDHAQLPPVCRCNIRQGDFCRKCHITSCTAWQHAALHELATNVRQASDLEFLSFLNIIRHRAPTQQEIDACLQDCIVDEEQAHALLGPDTTVLCTHVEDVQMYNELMLQALFPNTHVEVGVALARTAPPGALDDETVRTCLYDPKFHTLPYVAVGARVTLTANTDLSIGACNGATGIVTALDYSKDGTINAIHVRLDSNSHVVKMRRTAVRRTYNNLVCITGSTFSLMLGYALTGHRCQGATIANTVLLHPRDAAWCPGLMYVMLSRVTDRRFLRIVGTLKPSMFTPMPRVA